MNANQIINMIIRQVMRKLINGGINKSMDVASKGLSKRRTPDPDQADTPDRRV